MTRATGRSASWRARALTGVVGVTLLVAATSAMASGPERPATVTVSASVTGPATTGVDIGWPQCPKSLGGRGDPLPPDATTGFAIVEINAGLAAVPNRCLRDHLSWAREHKAWVGVYFLPNYPDVGMRAAAGDGRYGRCATTPCRLRTSGYQQAEWALAQASAAGMSPTMVWVDVEHQPRRPWSHDVHANRLVLGGVFDALRDRGIAIGLYSYRYGWRQIVGSWRLSYPEWVPTGSSTAAARRTACGRPGFSTGPVWITQSTRAGHPYDLDDDTLCARVGAKAGKVFVPTA